MPTVSKKPAAKAPAVTKPRTGPVQNNSVAGRAAAARPPTASRAPASKPAATAPEVRKAATGKRQRLSKAFSRPLDKKLRKAALVRERFTLPESEYAQLAVLKKRMSDRDIGAKKSELVRAGLMLLAALDDDALQALLAKVPRRD